MSDDKKPDEEKKQKSLPKKDIHMHLELLRQRERDLKQQIDARKQEEGESEKRNVLEQDLDDLTEEIRRRELERIQANLEETVHSEAPPTPATQQQEANQQPYMKNNPQDIYSHEDTDPYNQERKKREEIYSSQNEPKKSYDSGG